MGIVTGAKKEQDSLAAMGSALREVAKHQKALGVGQSPRDHEKGICVHLLHQDDEREGEEGPAIWFFPERPWDMERVGREIDNRQMKL